MPNAFARTMRSLDADRFRGSLAGMTIAVAVLGAWGWWMFTSRVALFEVTDIARVEVDRATFTVQSPVAGRVVATRLTLGADVKAGDVLVEVEADTQRGQTREEQARLEALAAQRTSVEREIAAAGKARRDEQEAAAAALEQARAQHREASATAGLAEDELDRLTRLRAQGLISEREHAQAKAEAQRRRAAADSFRLALARLEREQKTRESDRDTTLERLAGEITRIDGLTATTRRAIERLETETARRVIRAPVSGKLGEIATLRLGGVLREGDKLGAIVPSGRLAVVAEFPPAAALGRVRAGQTARLRLHGFPWAQYGTVTAKVSRVASEVRDGRIRVELAIEPGSAPLIPIQHGLPGDLEVEVERVSPATLVLRAAGRLLAAPRNSFSRSAS